MSSPNGQPPALRFGPSPREVAELILNAERFVSSVLNYEGSRAGLAEELVDRDRLAGGGEPTDDYEVWAENENEKHADFFEADAEECSREAIHYLGEMRTLVSPKAYGDWHVPTSPSVLSQVELLLREIALFERQMGLAEGGRDHGRALQLDAFGQPYLLPENQRRSLFKKACGFEGSEWIPVAEDFGTRWRGLLDGIRRALGTAEWSAIAAVTGECLLTFLREVLSIADQLEGEAEMSPLPQEADQARLLADVWIAAEIGRNLIGRCNPEIEKRFIVSRRSDELVRLFGLSARSWFSLVIKIGDCFEFNLGDLGELDWSTVSAGCVEDEAEHQGILRPAISEISQRCTEIGITRSTVKLALDELIAGLDQECVRADAAPTGQISDESKPSLQKSDASSEPRLGIQGPQEGFYSARELAEFLDRPYHAFRRALERWRKRAVPGVDWAEQDGGAVGYRYRLSSVRARFGSG